MKKSNLLELFVHFHDTFLADSQPFFAEPGFLEIKGTKKGEVSSKLFNENALLNSLRNMINTIKNNPFPEFKQIVSLFLKEQKTLILENLRKYLGEDLNLDSPLFFVPFAGTSLGFRKTLRPLYEELSKLFENL